MPRSLHQVLATILLTAALAAQEPQAPAPDANTKFDANAKVVLVPFNVQRGKDFAADLQPSDVILREDGHPRAFATFEGPNTPHPLPLEITLLFDTTIVPAKSGATIFHWDPKADYEFIGGWDERLTGALLQQNGMDIRMSVYHYADNQLERLCAATSDPRQIVQAFQHLNNPIPAGQGELALLPGHQVQKPMFDKPWMGWMTESIAATLKEAAASTVTARRLLIVFTQGMNGTSSKSGGIDYDSMSGPSLALNIPINLVILDQYRLNVTWTGPGPGGVLSTLDMPKELAEKAGLMAGSTAYRNLPWVAALGGMTGGEVFVPQHLDRETLVAILRIERATTLARYVVGFTPEAAAKAKKHSLEVTLKSKSSGKIVGGEKNGVVY